MKPMSVLEALVIQNAGWSDEYQRRLCVEAAEVLQNAATTIRGERMEPLPPRPEVVWVRENSNPLAMDYKPRVLGD